MCEGYAPKPFLCKKCGWIIGESYRESGSRITQLRVYRMPRHPGEGLDMRPIAEFMKFGVMRMNDGAVACSCGTWTSWYANQTAIDEMLERKHGREKVT